MVKKKKSLFNIFCEAIRLYISNIGSFMKYMTFPVLGQILGLGLVFFITYFYSLNLPKLLGKYPNLDNFNTLILISVLITLPGLAIFCKAFWEYLVAYGAINSMVDNMLKSGRVYDFDAHRELIKRRSAAFIGLWILFSIFSLAAILPVFWIICAIFAIYFVLIFQAFTFQPELSPIECVKQSFMLVKGHFASTFVLFAFAGIVTYLIVPQLFAKMFEILSLDKFLTNTILPFVTLFPEINLNTSAIGIIKHQDIANFTIQTFLAQIVIQYTLPIRSILWSLWYKELGGDTTDYGFNTKTSQSSKGKNSKRKKRPSEKLMEASNKKFSKSKIDSNILRRAMEKDDED